MKMAYEAFTGKKPNVQNMNVFDTICYAYIQEKKKLDPRSEKGLFLGLAHVMASQYSKTFLPSSLASRITNAKLLSSRS